MMITLSRLYTDGTVARSVVDELKATGLPEDDVGIPLVSVKKKPPTRLGGE